MVQYRSYQGDELMILNYIPFFVHLVEVVARVTCIVLREVPLISLSK
jgi:hypothetical protein